MAWEISENDTDIAGTLTRIFGEISVQLTRAQEAATALPDAEREFRTNALKRLFTDLAPLIETLRARIQRGVLTATSDTEVLLSAGNARTWIVAEADRTSFAPSTFVLALRRLSSLDTALLRVTSWDATVGALTAEVVEITGNPGPHADWEFVSGPGVVTAQRAWLAEARTALADARAVRDVVTAAAAQVASDKLIIGMTQAGIEQAARTATDKAAEATAAAARANTWDPTNYYPKAAIDLKFSDLRGTADAQHDTLGELATLTDANTAAIGATNDVGVRRDFYGPFYGSR